MTLHVVTGPPCAGKSTHVRDHAQPGDVRIDYDLLATALGSETSHAAKGAVRTVAFAAREAAINAVLAGVEGDAWVIHTNPKAEQIQTYADAGAVFVHLDPGLEVCRERAAADQRPEETLAAIEQWYAAKAEASKEKAMTTHTMTKSASVTVKAVGPSDPGASSDNGLAPGEFKALVSVFNNVDTYGDVVMPGFFAEVLADYRAKGQPIPVVWAHQWADVFAHIGHVEPTKAYETDEGLEVIGLLDVDSPIPEAAAFAQQVHRLMSQGRISQFSFAFDVADAGWGVRGVGETQREVFELRKAAGLHEVGPCLVGVNGETRLDEVKALRATYPRKSAETPDLPESTDSGAAEEELNGTGDASSEGETPPLDPTSAALLAEIAALD